MTEALEPDARPMVRFWWFAQPITPEEIDRQLDWIVCAGFGGVEIAWIYPLERNPDTPRFLSADWTRLVSHAAAGCADRGLVCDFTFGSLWPFGGLMVTEEHASRTDEGISPQRLDRSWEMAYAETPGFILDHLNHTALEAYAGVIGPALRPAIDEASRLSQTTGHRPAIFCDSWEVEPERLWTNGFGDRFEEEYGYRVEPFMDRLDQHLDIRFDYRILIATLAIEEFYRPLTDIAHCLGCDARVQAHGAPTDLIEAYGCADIPESEALLFDPPFSLIATSAAAQTGRPVVSAEAFTCLYGWTPRPGPSPGQGSEQMIDLKLLADALFAAGVNQIVWHGMPFSTPEHPERFYTTTHVGPDSGFACELEAFNRYLAGVSSLMREGRPESRVAVYLPFEDALMAGELPEHQLRPSARWEWEMHYQRIPEEFAGYAPFWTGLELLSRARVDSGVIVLGAHRFRAITVDAEWLRCEVVEALVGIAEAGGAVLLGATPREPGSRESSGYRRLVDRLRAFSLSNGFESLRPGSGCDPLVRSVDPEIRIPPFFCRRIDGAEHSECDETRTRYRFFFAHPKCREISYPMYPGEMREETRTEVDVEFLCFADPIPHRLVFASGGGRIVDVSAAAVTDLTPDWLPAETGGAG